MANRPTYKLYQPTPWAPWDFDAVSETEVGSPHEGVQSDTLPTTETVGANEKRANWTAYTPRNFRNCYSANYATGRHNELFPRVSPEEHEALAADFLAATRDSVLENDGLKWKRDIESDPAFQDMSAKEKYLCRDYVWKHEYAPQVPEDQRDAVQKEFYLGTSDGTLGLTGQLALAADAGIRPAADNLTFGLADKAVAAGRAAFDSDLDYDKALAKERASTDLAGEILGKPAMMLADASGAVSGGVGAKKPV